MMLRRLLVCALLCAAFACSKKESETASQEDTAKASVDPGGSADNPASGGATAAAVDVSKMAEGDWGSKLLGVALEHESCQTRAPAMQTLAAEAEASGQPGWAAALLGNIANCQIEAGNPDQAMATLNRAAELGLSDCFYLRTDAQMKKLAGRDDFKALLGRIKTSPADVHEVAWLASEVQAILHDTNMMVSENMNRVDGQPTLVPQSEIPTRASSDPSVIAGRIFLAAFQRYQKSIVLQSDQARMSHNTSMGIIDNMGDGTSGRASPMRVQQSLSMAQQAAELRAQQVDQRAFKDSGASSKAVSCSEIPD